MNVKLPIAVIATIAATGLGVAAILAAGMYNGAFPGAPPAPLAYANGGFLDGMDVQVHDGATHFHPTTTHGMTAQHGSDCAGPPATHVLTGNNLRDAVFQCNDHVMTALRGEDYAVVYLTPPELVDFATQGTVQFDISTQDVNSRDWWDVTISPFADSQALPLLSDLSQGVDLQRPNRNSIVITTDNGEGRPNLQLVTDGVTSKLGGSFVASDGIPASINQAAVRQTFRLTLSPTHVRFERLASTGAPGRVHVDRDIPARTWTRGVVQFGHHSYSPDKDGPAQTWHWDNFIVSPAVPFHIGKVTPFNTRGGTFTAQVPAPANAFLRFSAICRPVVNGVAATKHTDDGHPEHFSSYMVPVPQGSTQYTIGFTNDSFWNNPCLAKDASVFALTGGAPSATPTASPSPTATTSPSATPTASPPPSPTATLTATPTATASPTATPSATPSPTPATDARCRVDDRNDANTAWVTREGSWTAIEPGLWICVVPRNGRIP